MNTSEGTFAEASAPGRLDVMGGIADYSGSLVLQLPIRQRTSVIIKLRSDYHCTLLSKTKLEKLVGSVDYRDVLEDGKVNYEYAQKQFRNNSNNAWMAYVLGCVLVLQRERQIDFRGADFLIQSDVPLGKGVSSSAALEVATMKALGSLFGISFTGTQLPLLAQQAENLVVGAPCGLMDQLTSCFGEPRQLLPILCQPDQIMEPIAIPPSVYFVGIDSGIRHSVGASSYTDVRCAAFMGYTLLAQAAGAREVDILKAVKERNFSKLPFGGYLSNIQPDDFESRFKRVLPDSMQGREFLEKFPQTIDHVTTVNEATRYAVRTCAAHPIYEHERVRQFIEHLLFINGSNDSGQKERRLTAMGELMKQSHQSYSDCGLGTARTDEIVEEAYKKRMEGIFGAKITGGGNGGTVCLLAAGGHGLGTVRELHRQLESKYKTKLELMET